MLFFIHAETANQKIAGWAPYRIGYEELHLKGLYAGCKRQHRHQHSHAGNGIFFVQHDNTVYKTLGSET